MPHAILRRMSPALEVVEELGRITQFFLLALRWLFRRPFRMRVFIDQFYFIANKSVFIISVTGLFTGMVFAVQFYFGFRMVQADTLVGPSSALALTRELAPVFSAVVVTGRAGAAMAAELGTMRVTEQIDAMDVMAVPSMQYLVVPRILAGFLALPVLSALYLFIGNVGAYSVGVYFLGIDPALFYAHLDSFVFPEDVVQSLVKAACFGVLFSTIGTYYGYTASGGARAVGQATNNAVVVTLVVILVSDYFLSLLIRQLLDPWA